MFKLEIVGVRPVPASRPRVTSRGTFNTKSYTDFKKFISMRAKMLKPKISDMPIEMELHFFYKYPKSWSKKKKESTTWHTSRPDEDNLSKSVMDALDGIVYKDDSQVCKKYVTKRYANEYKIIIEAKEIV